jgi:hypothetical protein
VIVKIFLEEEAPLRATGYVHMPTSMKKLEKSQSAPPRASQSRRELGFATRAARTKGNRLNTVKRMIIPGSENNSLLSAKRIQPEKGPAMNKPYALSAGPKPGPMKLSYGAIKAVKYLH